MAQGYTTSTKLISDFGGDNILTWANVEGETIAADYMPTSAQAAAIATAIDEAETSLHEDLYGFYDLPFAATFPPSIVQNATRLAALYLYAGMRGARDAGRNDQITLALDLYEKWIKAIRSGRKRILGSDLVPLTREGSTAPS